MWKVVLGSWMIAIICGGCTEERNQVPPSRPSRPSPPPEPREEVVVPKDFAGPIDPEWPPTHAADLKVELEASRLLREALRARPRGPKKVAGKMSDADTLGLYVERGQIGGFEYLEVIVGPLRDPDAPMPLVVYLHGRGGRARVPAGPFDVEHPFRMFIPQSPDKLGPGYTWFATWTNSGQVQLLARSVAARADQLAPAIEAFRRSNPTLGKPIVVGFSQGAIMSLTLATRYPARFSAAFPMAGWLPQVLHPAPTKGQKFPYIYAQHGTKDKTVPIEYGRNTVRQLRALGLRVDYRERPGVGHVVSKEMEVSTRRGVDRILRALSNPTNIASPSGGQKAAKATGSELSPKADPRYTPFAEDRGGR